MYEITESGLQLKENIGQYMDSTPQGRAPRDIDMMKFMMLHALEEGAEVEDASDLFPYVARVPGLQGPATARNLRHQFERLENEGYIVHEN